MSYTNETANYGLPQWIGTDKPTFLGDFNSAFDKIDEGMKANADAASAAVSTANSASSAATTAANNAATALSRANTANTTANAAQVTAGTAQTAAGAAQTAAGAAQTAARANSIENLAPAYDSSLTYAVGDLVTYVNPTTGNGKLYKCIVAVTSPMEFNINFWDDVTVSKAFVHDEIKVLASVSGDGTKTFRQIMNELVTAADLGTIDVTKVQLRITSGLAKYVFLPRSSTQNAYIFGNIYSEVTSVTMESYEFAITEQASSNGFTNTLNISDGTVTHSESANNVFPNNALMEFIMF